MPDDFSYADPFLAAATTGPVRPRRDALAPVAGVIDARVHTVPAITRRREEMAYTGPDPLLMRVVETVMVSTVAKLSRLGPVTPVTAETLRSGVVDAVTAIGCDLAAELEALRSTITAAREDLAMLIGSTQDRAVRVALEAVGQRLVEVGR